MSSSIPSKLFDSTATIDELKALVNRFVEERSWKSFHSPKNLAMSISIEAAELMEHFQWTNPDASSGPLSHDSPVAQELSDVLAYSFALASVLGIGHIHLAYATIIRAVCGMIEDISGRGLRVILGVLVKKVSARSPSLKEQHDFCALPIEFAIY